jgi:hypothetical protein
MRPGTWRAEFFDDWDDQSPPRSVIVFAQNEDDAVEKAAAQIGDAARLEFTRIISRGQ